MLFITIFLIVFAFDLIPVLRGGWGWQWAYAPIIALERLIPLILVSAIYWIGVWQLRQRQASTALVWWAWIGIIALSFAFVHVRDDTFSALFARTVSPVYTGASSAAVQYFDQDWLSPLRQWTHLMTDLAQTENIHIALSPPAQPLIHAALSRLFEQFPTLARPLADTVRPYQCASLPTMLYTQAELASALIGAMMPIWSALAVFPLYYLAHQLGQHRQAAARIVSWYPLIPSLLFFAPSWNTLYPFLVLSSMAFLLKHLRGGSAWYGIIAGGWMSCATLMNFSVVPALMLMGWFTLGYWWWIARHQTPAKSFVWTIWVGLRFGVGLASLWVIFGAITGYTPLDLIRTAFDQHLEIERNYWIWLVLHLYDMALFAGWALVGLGCVAMGLAFKRGLFHQKILHPAEILGVSLALTLFILDLSNAARGETARVWLFFVPFLLLAMTSWLATKPFTWDMGLLALQAVTVIVFASVIPPMNTFLDDTPTSPASDFPMLQTSDLRNAEVIFTSAQGYRGAFRLDRYRFIADPSQQAISLELFWQALEPIERPYEFELIAMAENDLDGQVASTPYRWYPQHGRYLTTCWQQGELIRELHIIPLPPVSQPVVWTLSLRGFEGRVGDTLRVQSADGMIADVMVFDPIPYP